jgi:steroid delta-isomerase-like uncharacterized protein
MISWKEGAVSGIARLVGSFTGIEIDQPATPANHRRPQDPRMPHPTPRDAAETLVRAYYAAFNAGDRAMMAALLAEDVVHDVNQGGRRQGLAAFRAFLAQMDAAYEEQLEELVVMADGSGQRAAAEFVVRGRYLRSEPGLPPARGQAYRLPAGAFLAIANGKITRVTTYYNLADWIAQVEQAAPGG